MSTKTIENFFTGKTLVIPSYQRDYAWRERNVDDLFDDVEEALEVGGGHYLGTFILSQQDRNAPVHVVDGQQRLTTLTMLLDALIDAVDDANIKQHYRNTFIEHPVTGAKFRVLGDNEVFFRELLDRRNPVPVSDGQERLRNAYLWIRHRVNSIKVKGGQELVKQWLLCLSNLEVLEFIESNEGKAIRMFQSVNDRGVPLAKMDIVKSLLVYYSNRYLDGELDEFVSSQFGQAFRSFSRIKKLACESGYKVRQIDRDAFREDDVLRYHYLAFDGTRFGVAAGGDYSATSETVLEAFLKPALKDLRGDQEKLNEFIKAYTTDLTEFFAGLEALIQSTRTDMQSYLLWVVQDLSATLYPLVIRLHLKGWLNERGTVDARDLMDIIELADLRVFKLRGTNPQADIFRITRELHQRSIDWVISALQHFCNWGMPDAMMASRLVDEDMYRNPALPRMLLQEEVMARAAVDEPKLSLQDLATLNQNGLTVEHILPQDPENSFSIDGYGFGNDEDYLMHKHKFGNLVLLEGSINSACKNRTVEDKMTVPTLYMSSSMCAPKALAASCAGDKRFSRSQLIDRSKRLSAVVVDHWPIRKSFAVHPTEDIVIQADAAVK
ncbi:MULTISPECIES: DUF262 domain-containing protein [Paraburkholderia]|uniref:DUF262 domain-containing protein n=1 Tax=Paraburkholderia TaxID=1822464 RepID=UPI0022524287|nr:MULTISPECIES: DUF262 domain-containing HNH endonuclease family protein [Paraburkholderia]MCX4176797.1 DUF262 domain-containing HNH endonuclease family protein [Paraburkholderia madseniana]MDQ6464788.1 DUF262 domain-containing HNH endonuclease family protein [Paraburkholderia madseniana]